MKSDPSALGKSIGSGRLKPRLLFMVRYGMTKTVQLAISRGFAVAVAALATVALPFAASAADVLPLPNSVVIDRSVPALQREAMSLAARRYYAFWDTGDVFYANAALAPDFVDRNLPPGRPQGPEGPVFASKNFRTAVPDLHVEVEEMLVVGDRVIGRLRFTGHFTGTFGNGAAARQGDGRAIDFIAIDIYRIANGRIAENWHLEDNLALLQQLGAIGR
jgi:predicted ester cyclase